ncbi:recombinase family protein [Elizabethkingia anophelis]|uniref:Transposon Tn552 DNA-invertase bin3 n=1 Tax=Elizabethkingia anophelis TaxID=1117645 RepID=A0A7Z7LV08_9FLAO|nr:recombinase family protein [Elizabethkingia anophelis]MCT3810332.1 recombinase family protein [Elizabethkingia anophelis]MCT3828284.1 recombinase family protein [Elizabethkingia anophelis]MCT3839091.1 recombinase family protein [Elizabethkingia anophelis]MCT3842833.1 recombinase family protein [Elizabethkingia anophelis]MCT3849921.1 recombinase family protein [Elizabethkingia anophelis]
MKARYIRVSTGNQNTERQLEKNHPNEKLYIDIVSGATPFKEREQGNRLIQDIEADSIKYISVHSIDRLGRNLFDILATLELLNEKKVTLKVDNLGIESLVNNKPNSAFKLIISVMANIAEMERETMLERQKEGIKIAIAKGVYKGRVKGSKESDEQVLAKYKEVVKYLKRGQSLRDIAKLCNVSLGTVQKVKKILNDFQ